jgi:hypothetical protein
MEKGKKDKVDAKWKSQKALRRPSNKGPLFKAGLTDSWPGRPVPSEPFSTFGPIGWDFTHRIP